MLTRKTEFLQKSVGIFDQKHYFLQQKATQYLFLKPEKSMDQEISQKHFWTYSQNI